MLSEFKEYIELLNTYRIKSNFITIEELLEKVYLEVTYSYSNLSEMEAIMAKGKNKNKALSEGNPIRVTGQPIPEGIDPKAERLLQALSDLVTAATEYIGKKSIIAPSQVAGNENLSRDNSLFPDTSEDTDAPDVSIQKPEKEDIFADPSPPQPSEEKKTTPAESVTVPAPEKGMADLITECRQLLIALAKKTMDIKTVDKFFVQFSQIVGVPLTQLSDIKDIETLNLCKQFLEKQI